MVNAGPDQTITLPSAATLSGSATDDGLPNPPGAVTYAWSKFSGPGTVTFGTATAATTTATFSTAGVYTLRLTANDGALSGFDDLVVTVNGSSGTAVYRINVAGGAFTDSQGRAWSADANFTGTTSTFAVGQPISGTVDDALYQKVRYGSSFAYALPIANGTYTVVLHVAEIWFTGAGQRVFDVAAEGGVVVDNLDVWAAAGAVCGVDAGVPDDGGGRGVEPGVHVGGGQRERLGDRGADHRAAAISRRRSMPARIRRLSCRARRRSAGRRPTMGCRIRRAPSRIRGASSAARAR